MSNTALQPVFQTLPIEPAFRPFPIVNLEENPAAVYLAGLSSQKSKDTMESALNHLAALITCGQCTAFDCPWHTLRYQHTHALAAKLPTLPRADGKGNLSPATCNKYLAALRSVLKEAWRLRLMETDEYMRAVDLKRVKGKRLMRGRMLTSGEKSLFFIDCAKDLSPAGRRDAALFSIGIGAGLRRAEIVALDLEHCDLVQGEIVVHQGKGNKDRRVPLKNNALRALAEWVEVRGSEPGPLFFRINKGGRMIRERITDQALYNMLEKRRTSAGIKRFSPHDMRRTFASTMLDNADPMVVQAILGHENIQTTVKYDRRGEKAVNAAAERFNVDEFVSFRDYAETSVPKGKRVVNVKIS